MNCINHPSKIVVSQCLHCGKGLCIECTNKFLKPICTNCFAVYRKKIITEILLTFLVGLPIGLILGALIFEPGNTNKNLWANPYFMMYMGIGFVPGWKTLTKVTPGIFLLLPVLGWIFYFFIKSLLSLFIGLFALPIRMVENILTLFE